jgi:uncharacterized delta-60 repeat protein
MRIRLLLTVVAIVAVAVPRPRADVCTGRAGTLDGCFGVGGMYVNELLPGGFESPWDLAVQLDRKIVVVGESRAANETFSRFTVLRYLADGSGLDTLFGGGVGIPAGMVRTTFAGTNGAESAKRVVLQSDGKIVVLGKAPMTGKGNAKDAAAVARYLPNGTLDGSFGAGGKVLFPFGNDNAWPQALALQGTKILVGGRFGTSAVLARLNDNGSLDSGFGVGGKVTPVTGGKNGNATIKDITIDSGGRIVAVGGLNGDVLVLRLSANGAPDTTFDGDGKVTTDFAGFFDYAEKVAIDANGRIVVAGVVLNSAEGGASVDVGVMRYSGSNGAPDPDFGSGSGKVTFDVDNRRDQFTSLVLQSNGRILVAGSSELVGYSQADFAIARLLEDGSRDFDFGTDGITLTDFFGATDYGWGGLGIQMEGEVPKAIHAGSVEPQPFRVGLTRYFLQ